MIFLFVNSCSLIQISPTYVTNGTINNKPWLINALVPDRHQGIIWTNDGLVYWSIYLALGLNELTP